MVFLKITQPNITKSAGVVCNDKRKFSLVCFTSQRLAEAQVNSITYFLNNNLEKNDFRSKQNSFRVEIIEINRLKNIICCIFRTDGGENNLAKETATIHFFPNDAQLGEGNFKNVIFGKKI